MSRRSYKLTDQVYYVLQNINLIDDTEKRLDIFEQETGDRMTSLGKRDFKKIGISNQYIFSINTMKNTLIQSNKFVDFCKEEYDIKRLVQITPDMAKEYLVKVKDEGVSSSTLKVIKNAILKLDSGIDKSYANTNHIYTSEIKNFSVGQSNAYDRIYSSQDIQNIIGYAKEHSKYGTVLEVQLDLGLRISEVCNIKGIDITLGTGETILSPKFGEIDTSNTVRIQGKGGLVRYCPIPLDKISMYQELKEQTEGKIFKTDRNYMRQVFQSACKGLGIQESYKTHEIRKEYARQEVQNKIEDFRTSEGRDPNASELREIQCKVVSQLGHGRDRNDLIKIYCS